MKQFEATWRDGYENYERYYDTNLKKSFKKRIDLPYEWYEPCSTGLYTYILDETIKLDKRQGKYKDGCDKYGFLDPQYRNIRDNYWDKDDGYNVNPRVWFLDIETRVGTCSKGFPVPDKALEPISLIQFYDNQSEIMIVLGLRDWKHESDYSFDYDVNYIKCDDEIQLIDTFLKIYNKLNPLIVLAWNGDGFDFPYIYNRIKNLGMDVNRLSNYNNAVLKTVQMNNGQIEFSFKADGHFWMDMMKIYKSFVVSPRPSYALDVISEIELKERKVSHTEYSAFDDFYTGKYNIPENPTEEQKNSKIYQEAIKGNWDEVRELSHSNFVYYGCKDTYLIRRLDEKLKFVDLMTMISKKMGVQIGDTLGTVKPWHHYILNRSHQDGKILPPKQDHPTPYIIGGYVRKPNKGKHKWTLSADVNSMYPLLGMVGFNMSPETFIPKHKLPNDLRDIVLTYFNDQEESNRLNLTDDVWEIVESSLEKHNMSLGINGAVFTKEKLGMIPELVLEIYNDRKKAKSTMFEYEQRKILIKEILKEKS